MARARTTAALVATVAASAALVAGAFVSVAGAGCADQGRLVTAPDGSVTLVGGCVGAADLVVPGTPVPRQADPAPATTAPVDPAAPPDRRP